MEMLSAERAVEALAASGGPGGAIAVVHEGRAVVRRCWGFANAERRIPWSPQTQFRICSISKQFTVAAVLDACPDPSELDADVRAWLPGLGASALAASAVGAPALGAPALGAPAPGALHLMHNQSGLRDYWAEAMLHGAAAEGAFGDREAARVMAAQRRTMFAPGTQCSYVNQNFRILGDVLAERTGRSLVENLRSRVFGPAGMEGAFLAADTRAMPDGTEGYEGTEAAGFVPAVNRIVWTGDAGIGASLDDMVAWEAFIDRTRDDPGSLYGRLSRKVQFADGAAAEYGFGLSRGVEGGHAWTGHGGALRGWVSHRVHVAAARLSVVAMFNHMTVHARDAAMTVLRAALGVGAEAADTDLVPPAWLGAWMDEEAGLAARVEAAGAGRVRLYHGQNPETLDLVRDGSAGRAGGTRLVPEEGGLLLERPGHNRAVRLVPLEGGAGAAFAGRYACEEIGTRLEVVDAGGAMFGSFDGFLGQGRMERLVPAGPDTWMLPMPRALDFTPPWAWTLHFTPGREAVTVGCWLARGLRYRREG